MTEHHGENPIEIKMKWSTVNHSKSKKDNQEPITETIKEKDTPNEVVEVEIETI